MSADPMISFAPAGGGPSNQNARESTSHYPFSIGLHPQTLAAAAPAHSKAPNNSRVRADRTLLVAAPILWHHLQLTGPLGRGGGDIEVE